MFVPLHKSPDWRNPPVVTLGLMFLLLISYVLIQHNDKHFEQEAYTYYFRSELPDIELTRYIQFLKAQGQHQQAKSLGKNLRDNDIQGQIYVFHAMQADGEFQFKLHTDQIIHDGNAEYGTWKQQRHTYESLLQRISAFRFGLMPADFSPPALLTHLFLHADLSHLLFNLLFLFLFGFIVEMAWGRWATLATFLVSGIFSGIFYVWLEPDSVRWSIGASGAIAGLAGAYTVLFGMRRIRFFYFLFVYFDYVSAPALVLLPAWLLYELYDYLWAMNSVNNLAHIGGLLSGAGIALLLKHYTTLVNVDFINADTQQRTLESRLDAARKHVAHMEFDKARQILGALLTDYPEEREITVQLFHLAKLQPESAEFSQLTLRLLSIESNDKDTNRLLLNVLDDYEKYAGDLSKLPGDECVALARRFVDRGQLDIAARLLEPLVLQTSPNPPRGCAAALRALIRAQRRCNHLVKAEHFKKIYRQHFTDGKESTSNSGDEINQARPS